VEFSEAPAAEVQTFDVAMPSASAVYGDVVTHVCHQGKL
jgi:hypothetical protein